MDNEDDRAERLKQLLIASGLLEFFEIVGEIEPSYDDFTKLPVAQNGLRVLSFELYTHKTKPATLRLHHERGTPSWFREELGKIGGAHVSPTVGVNFSGDLMAAAKGIAAVVRENQIRWLRH